MSSKSKTDVDLNKIESSIFTCTFCWYTRVLLATRIHHPSSLVIFPYIDAKQNCHNKPSPSPLTQIPLFNLNHFALHTNEKPLYT